MSRHGARVHWRLDPAVEAAAFARGRFSRAHRWTFDGGLDLPASSSPGVIPPPWSDAGAVDPEEAFVAAVASCHMMSFLHHASRAGRTVLAYADDAVGELGRNADGRRWIAKIVLDPRITWADGTAPDDTALAALHAAAHAECFIANSVRTEVVVAGLAAP